jgi:putative DNA primase/helicase
MSALDHLADHERWVGWRNEPRGNKLTKIPYGRAGKARADDPATWVTRAEAEAIARRIVNGRGGGVGIELGDIGGDQHLAGIDLDSCLSEGELAPWAAAILQLADSYAEISPSGGGLKMFFYIATEDVRWFLDLIGVAADQWGCRRDVPGEDARDHGPAIELYLAGRYFATTENQWPAAPDRLRHLDRPILERLADLIPPRREAGSRHADNSRSAIALRKGAALRRAGKSFEEMCDALRADPETADWCREKGDAGRGRELRRIWAKLAADNEDADPRPPEYSDEALALRFAAKHGAVAAYVAPWNRWFLWSGEQWSTDSSLRAFDLARAVCRNASAEITDPKKVKLAAAVASAKTVAAVVTLARADRRHAATVGQWDPDPLLFLTTGE